MFKKHRVVLSQSSPPDLTWRSKKRKIASECSEPPDSLEDGSQNLETDKLKSQFSKQGQEINNTSQRPESLMLNSIGILNQSIKQVICKMAR